MNEIIEAFGINGKLLIIQIINFLILLLILQHFLYKPLLSMVDKRRKIIEDGVENAKEAEIKLASAKKEGIDITSRAQQEGLNTISLAKKEAQLQAAMLLQKAKEDGEEKLRDALKEGEKVKSKILLESQMEVAKLSILAAEKVLREEVREEGRKT